MFAAMPAVLKASIEKAWSKSGGVTGNEGTADGNSDLSASGASHGPTDNESVRAREGNLEDDECYGCVPLQALGGTASIETFKKVKYREYLELALQVTGKVLWN